MADRPVLGISAFFHDSAAALVDGDEIVAAAQEERFTRRKHDPSFPHHAIAYCLREAGISVGDLAAVAFYEDSALKFRRIAATYAGLAPFGFRSFRESLPPWLSWKLRMKRTVRRELGLAPTQRVITLRHHESHAASAFYPSPFDSAAVLCLDGVGEWATTSFWHGTREGLRPLAELRFPHSLGLLYSAFTYFCGFKVDSGEYKLMGLAPYGKPRYADLIRRELLDLKPDGSFRLNLRYFEFPHGRVMTGTAFERLFGGPRRVPEGALTEREFDLAASVQEVTEEVVLRLASTARALTGESRLCLAGGVALNCVANGQLARAQVFDQLWVQPAAGDAGGALGAALATAGARPGGDTMRGARLGPGYPDAEIGAFLDHHGIPHHRLDEPALLDRVAGALADGKVVGWFQGRMEFGPRALGARSILGDARNDAMQSTMNLKIKFRESFRPFAPAVLAEDAKDWFELDQESPYMLLVADISPGRRVLPEEPVTATGLDLLRRRRSTIPAVTHVDSSARVQTVGAEAEPRYRRLLEVFKERTGCPVLVNTSFNVRGEPIVNTPAEAYTCFMRTDIDLLAIGGFLLDKAEQPEFGEETDWRDHIPLD
ncbi:carbamoyltransferase family protein [Amycolatopsis lurida]